MNNMENGMTVNRAVMRKMESLFSEGRINSWYRYRSTLRALEEFAGGQIEFGSISAGWLEECESYWRSSGKNPTTIGIYMKSLRCIYTSACGDSGPFDGNGYRIPRACSRKIALSSSGIKAVLEWDGKDEKIAEYRDLWVFSYLCNGINFKDMLQLRYSSIVDGEIVFVRSKTRESAGYRPIRAYITDGMWDIIRRRGNHRHGRGDSYIFGYLDGNESPFQMETKVRTVIRNCNASMRLLAEELHIPAFTTYSARHTFATVLKRRGVALSYISECLGHTDIRTTERYLAGFETEDRMKFSSYLTDF